MGDDENAAHFLFWVKFVAQEQEFGLLSLLIIVIAARSYFSGRLFDFP